MPGQDSSLRVGIHPGFGDVIIALLPQGVRSDWQATGLRQFRAPDKCLAHLNGCGSSTGKAVAPGVLLENPCAELKELELAFSQYAERRVNTIRVVHERRRQSDFVHWRTAQARAAYMIQMHRQSCPLCKTLGQESAQDGDTLSG